MTQGRWDATRAGEIEITEPLRADAQVQFIGRISTPFPDRDACPRQGTLDGPLCHIEVFAPWRGGLAGIETPCRMEVLYWMDQARRDLIIQKPGEGTPRGTFALRSPVRPNPIALSLVQVESLKDGVLEVRGLDCVDGTPLLDLKPERR